MAISIIMNDHQATKFLQELKVLPLKRHRKLLNRIGVYARDETKRKVASGGGVGPSKWVRARKGTNKALEGMENKVHLFQDWRMNSVIIESIDPRYTLAQHARGYTKPAGSGGPEDRVFGEWVVIPLKRPSELTRTKKGKMPNPFMYRWTVNKRPSVVPARDILPTDQQMATQGNIIAQKWVQEVVSEALSKVGL